METEIFEPGVYCFLDDEEARRIYDLEEHRAEIEEYGTYDWNRDDYEIIVDREKEVTDYGRGWDPEVLYVRVIKRKSDGKYFRMRIHHDSWDCTGYLSYGSHGSITEVVPVEVTTVVYQEVK